MPEQIAVLDGLSDYGVSDPYTQDYDAFSEQRDVTPVPGGGANYTGGSDWFNRAPYRLQQEGMAGLGGALAIDPGGYDGSSFTPTPSSGANYQGGSSWHPYTPTRVSAEGLASTITVEEMPRVPGYAGQSFTPVPGGGANYTGGSDWFPGAPTRIPSEGLVGLAAANGITAKQLRLWVACGVINVMRSIGISRTASDVERTVSAIMSLGFPRRVALNAGSVSYLSALYTARRVGASMRQAAMYAKRASQLCSG